MDQEQSRQEKVRELARLIVPDWHPTTTQVVWTIRIAIVLSLLVAIGYSYDITLWDWIELLIVPAVLTAGGLWFNRQQQERQREDNRQQQEHGLEIENQRAQDEALQAYLNQMAQLLLDRDRPLRESQKGDEVRALARAWTVTVLERLDGNRKGSVLRFLYESALIGMNDMGMFLMGMEETEKSRDGMPEEVAPKHVPAVVKLEGADLRGIQLLMGAFHGVDLRGTVMSGAYLAGAQFGEGTDQIGAQLEGAALYGANLIEAELGAANLTGADLAGALLHRANLSNADLTDANLPAAILERAHMQKANLSRANLTYTNFSQADLTDADLTGARGITNEELLRQAFSINGATMPNGQKYEDWLKDQQ